ncbi:MAG TPA: hypothetical protein VNT24_10635, partial [Propionibacteriaceae bacterium]|nr:hypothetical protein [Propionibacteriaceae bacterium]
MICLTCAALAVWWAVPPPARPGQMEPPLADGSAGSVSTASPRWSGSPGWSTVGGVLGCGLLVVVGSLLDGGRGAVLGAA